MLFLSFPPFCFPSLYPLSLFPLCLSFLACFFSVALCASLRWIKRLVVWRSLEVKCAGKEWLVVPPFPVHVACTVGPPHTSEQIKRKYQTVQYSTAQRVSESRGAKRGASWTG